LEILRLVKVPLSFPQGPTDAEGVVRGLARQRWEAIPSECDLLLETIGGRPALDSILKDVWRDVEQKLSEPDPPGTEDNQT
jgi:hypothetical protein